MAFIDRKEQPTAPRGFDLKSDGFSEQYVRFITSRCEGRMSEDGLFRNEPGARFCSCSMCGKVATTEMQGKLYCDYHFPYRGNGFEEEVCTRAMHRFRSLLLIEAAAREFEVSPEYARFYEPYVELYDAECRKLGVPLMSGSETMFSHIRALIETAVADAQQKALEKAIKEGRKPKGRSRDLAEKLNGLKTKLSMSRAIHLDQMRPPHPAEDEEYAF